MIKTQKRPDQNTTEAAQRPGQAISLGEFAHQVIAEQYRHMVKQDKKVLADKDPEYLHQMRVGGRRLYTALQVFEGAIALPKAGRINRVKFFTKLLGQLRDLDVQIAALQTEYYPQIESKTERTYLQLVLVSLAHQRRKVLAGIQDMLIQTRYQEFKLTYEFWLANPSFTLLADLPLLPLLPDLLSPLLAKLLLHPGWLIGVNDISDDNSSILHDLRKACKHVRYQADFFVPFYREPFQDWIKEVKGLQESLGQLHDTQVLQEKLQDILRHDFQGDKFHLGEGKGRSVLRKQDLKGLHLDDLDLKHLDLKEVDLRKPALKELNAILEHQQTLALIDWEETRQRYLSSDYRQQLRRMLLETH